MLTTVNGAPAGYQLTTKKVVLVSANEIEIYLKAKTDWAQYWVAWCDGRFSAVYYVEDDVETIINMNTDPTWTTHLVYVFPLGKWSYVPGGADLATLRSRVEEDLGIAIDVEWNAPIEFLQAYDDNDQFEDVVVSGLSRNLNCVAIQGVPTQAKLDVSMTNADVGGSTYVYVSLWAGTKLVSYGSAIFSGGTASVTLAEQNESGVSGSLTVVDSTALPLSDGAYFLFGWPKEYTLAEGTSTLRVIEDDSRANRFACHLDSDADGNALSSGTHSIKLKIKSDTDTESSFGTPVDIDLVYKCPSPSGLVYLDGDRDNTRIQFETATSSWAASTAYSVRDWVAPATGALTYAHECITAGTSGESEPTWATTLGNTTNDGTCVWVCRAAVSYSIYENNITDDAIQYSETPISESASRGTITSSLNALPVGAEPGVRLIEIVAQSGFVRDLKGQYLRIEYDSDGDVVLPGPNDLSVSVSSISGRTLSLDYAYNPGNDDLTPAYVYGWIVAEGETPDFSTPDLSEDIATGDDFGYRRGTVSFDAVATDGVYRWILRAATSAGAMSPSETLSDGRWLGTGVPDVPVIELFASA